MNTFKIKDVFSGKTQLEGKFKDGETVLDIKKKNGILNKNVITIVNNKSVKNCFILYSEDILVFFVIPKGGSARNSLLGVLALATGGAVASFLGRTLGFVSSSFWHTGITTLVSGALSKKWIAPPQINQNNDLKEDPTNYFINSQANEYRFNQKIPVILGDVKFAPPKAALDYSEVFGNDYYFRILLCCGYGKLEIDESEIKIGDTPISNYIVSGKEIIRKKGLDGEKKLTIFSNDVDEVSFNDVLEYNNPIIKRTKSDIDEISIDLSFPEGLFYLDENNNKLSNFVEFYVEYKNVGGSTWSSVTDIKDIILTDGIMLEPGTGYTFRGSEFVAGNLISGVPPRQNAFQFFGFDGDGLNFDNFNIGDSIKIDGSEFNDGTYNIIDKSIELGGKTFRLDRDLIDENANGQYIVSISRLSGTLTKITAKDKNTSSVRKSFSFKVPKGQYDIRVTRLTEDHDDFKYKDKSYFSVLRSIKTDIENLVPDGFSYIALKIKATDQLNGAIDTLTCRCQSYVDTWNGSSWVEQISNNPAWLALHVLKGAANREPATDDIIDIQAFKEWADWCDTNDYTFNAVIDSEVSVNDLLHDIASAGRANIFIKEGKWTVAQDISQAVPKYLISTRNILKDSYSFSKTFKKNVQCLKIKYANVDNKEDMYPVCIDGYGIPGMPGYNIGDIYPTEIEEMTIKGVTNPNQIYKLGRFWLNCEILRPFIHEFEMDIEHYNINKGDRILFSHGVLKQDISRGRIKNIILNTSNQVTGITVAEECQMILGENYIISYMNSDKTIIEQIAIVTNPENFYELTFSTPIETNIPEIGNYFIFGKNKVSSFLITDIEPTGTDKKAKVIAVDYNEAVYDLGVTPTYFSNITIQDKILNKIPPVPVIDSIVSDESVLLKKANALISRIAISIKQNSNSGIQPESYQAQYRLLGSTVWENVATTNASDRIVYISDVEDGSQYEIRLRSIYNFKTSEWTSSFTHSVVGKTNPPKNVTGFKAVIEGEYIKFSWDKNLELDVVGYNIYDNDYNKIGYADADFFNYKFVGTGSYNFYIKAVDAIKLESQNYVSISLTINAPDIPILSPYVERNKVYLDWQDCSTTFPIRTYKVRKDGTNWNSAQILNDNIGPITLFQTSEGTAGVKTYRIKAVDTSGNESSEAIVSTYVGDAIGFKLFLNNIKTDFTDVILNNAILDTDGKVLLPVNTSETIKEHFDNNNWSSPQNQIDDGYPLFIQPAYNQSGSLEFSFDVGTIIDEAQIITEFDSIYIDSPEIIVKTYISIDDINWTEYNSEKIYVNQDFRYVKIKIIVTAYPDTEILKISQIKTVIKLEEQVDKGISIINNFNQLVNFTKDFTDVEKLTGNIVNSDIPLTISLNGAVGEVSPTGFNVKIWDKNGAALGESGFLGTIPVKISWEAIGK